MQVRRFSKHMVLYVAPTYAEYPALGINITPISTIIEAPNCTTPPLPTLPHITAAPAKEKLHFRRVSAG